MKQRKGWRISCDVGKATEVLENELWRRWSEALLIIQPFRYFTYITSHSPSPSVALPTSQIILQPFRCITYVTAHSPTLLSLHLRHKLFTYVTWRAAHAVDLVLIYPPKKKIQMGSSTLCLHCSRILIPILPRKMDRKSIIVHHMACHITRPNTTWFFPLGFVKDKVYRTPVRDLTGLQERIDATANKSHYRWFIIYGSRLNTGWNFPCH